jgi:hypothetical protein
VPRGYSLMKKIEGRKSRGTVPLNILKHQQWQYKFLLGSIRDILYSFYSNFVNTG